MVKREIAIDSWETKSQIWKAMRLCIDDIKEQVDSLTFEEIRRVLENDLGLEKYALDGQKKFVMQCLVESLENDDDKNSEDLGEIGERYANVQEHVSDDEEKMEDSSVMGLLPETDPVSKKKEVPSKFNISKAMMKRVSYIKANYEELTTVRLCRLLEEDMGIEKFALDPFNKYISNHIDDVLQWADENSESLDREIDEDDEDEVKPKNKISAKQMVQTCEVTKKRKRLDKEVNASGKKQSKPVEETAKNNSGAKGTHDASNDSCSQLSNVKEKGVPTPAYGKNVEIKSETELMKEMKEIFFIEEFPSNTSEKEIMEVKKRKERVKEVEGIDMPNIVSLSCRRCTTSYVPHPNPKIPVDSDNSDADGTDEDDDEEEENDGDTNEDDGSYREDVDNNEFRRKRWR
ncbi:uncharacterized protein [Euphorbia lathyris]|uniref:uncharacterized protein n=1 Tax=Euphorbia lathyris TaxID=212925 RepID=UPI0033138C44